MTVTREDLQNLNSEYSFLIETNLKDKDQDSILRLGFWAKDNQDKIRQVLEDRLNKPVIPDNSATEYMKAVDDSLIYGQSLVHTDKEGNIKHVPIKDIYQPDYKAISEESCRILKGIIHCSDKGVKEMLSLYSDGDKIISKYRALKGE